MSYLDNITDQLQAASIMGKPDSRATVLFAGPPRQSLLAEGDEFGARNLFPIGLLTSMNTQDSRSNIVQEVIGLSEMIPYGYQRGRKIGVVTGLILFLADSQADIVKGTAAWTHFVKSLYKSLRASHPNLVLPFYSGSDEHNGSDFFEPIAHGDSDKWRNFSSPFFNIPVGLYKLERSEGQQTLEATYYETVRFEGTMNAQVTTSQAGPQFEQLAFTYSKALPMQPDFETLSRYVGGGGSDESGDSLTSYMESLREYLGVS